MSRNGIRRSGPKHNTPPKAYRNHAGIIRQRIPRLVDSADIGKRAVNRKLSSPSPAQPHASNVLLFAMLSMFIPSCNPAADAGWLAVPPSHGCRQATSRWAEPTGSLTLVSRLSSLVSLKRPRTGASPRPSSRAFRRHWARSSSRGRSTASSPRSCTGRSSCHPPLPSG
jgi:hypothetical protein